MKVDILYEVPIRLGIASTLSSEFDRISIEGEYRTVHIPILIGSFDPYLRDQINLFLLQKASDGHKDLSSMAKAFKTWVLWLIDNKVAPFAIPIVKSKSPTYGFRQNLLERITEKHDLRSSTANSYILVIKAFYETLYEDGILDKTHFYHPRVSTIDGYRKLQSSDLAIRVSRYVDDNLSPLEYETQARVLHLLEHQNEDFKLIFKLMFFCGLRLSEAISFPCKLINEDLFPNNESKLIRGIEIGPKHGVNTKFDSYRELFITVRLANEILDYELSEKNRIKKQKFLECSKRKLKHIPLFINQNGKPYSKNTFYSSWSRFKKSYKNKYHEDFTHRPHDLRSTFATNLLEVALKTSPDNVDTCIETTRLFMGHRRIETTLKYVKFLNRRKTANNVAEVMDKYIYDIFKEVA